MSELSERAKQVLRKNDRGGYSVPTSGLYPFQWNWDSAFTALGWSRIDRRRAWKELETLLAAQWPDGMVPHIVFWADDAGYFPGKDVWATGREPASSGISQPPVIASTMRWLVESGGDEDKAAAAKLLPKVFAYHRWYHSCRDPQNSGLVAIVHPWESGRDNSPEWDEALANVKVPADLPSYSRRDLDHVDAAMRPTNEQYDRYLSLVKHGRDCGWDAKRIFASSPFLVCDPGVQFILMRADRDLRELALLFDRGNWQEEIDAWLAASEAACSRLFNDDVGCYCALDLRSKSLGDGATSAGLLAWYAGLENDENLAALTRTAERFCAECRYALPSWDPKDERFDAKRYWRGPVWAIINYMAAKGMAEAGSVVLAKLAARIRADTLALAESGFAEYYDPLSGEPLGGEEFTWTAAVLLALAAESGTE